MYRRPPRSTRTDTLFPYTTLFRSPLASLWTPAQMTVRSDLRKPLSSPVVVIDFLRRSMRSSKSAQQRRRRYTQAREPPRSEEHTSELQSLMRISYAVFCLKKKTQKNKRQHAKHI